MPKYNQTGSRGKKGQGHKKGMCKRTDGELFLQVQNGRARGQSLGSKTGIFQGSLFNSETRDGVNPDQDDLSNLKEQYQVAQRMLRSIEKKIIALESGNYKTTEGE